MSRLSRLGFIDTSRTHQPVRRRIRPRGVPAALEGHEVFCTDDVALAADMLSKLFGATTIGTIGAGEGEEDFQSSLHAIRVRDTSMAHLDFRVPVCVDISRSGDHYGVVMPTSGQVRCTLNGATFDVANYHGLVVNPGVAVRLELPIDTPLLVIRIERDALERQLSRMLGRSVRHPVEFDHLMDLTRDEAVRWHNAIQIVSTEVMTEGSLLQRGRGAGTVEEFLISSLLLIQTSSTHEDLVRISTQRERRAVRRAIDYIEHNLADPITLDDIVTHTDMSRRSIQQGFHDDLATTPMAYVRNRRLERARDDLADAIPSDRVTVTDAAERWGFSHLGNFSAAYRKRFGESPSETLKR